MNEPRMLRPIATLTLLVSFPSMSMPGLASRRTSGAGDLAGRHEVRHHAEPRQVLPVAVHQLERLRRGARKTKHTEPVAFAET